MRPPLLCPILLGLTLLATPAAQAQDVFTPKPAEAVHLVFLRDPGPLLVRLNPTVGGKSLQGKFHTYLKKWVDFLDRDGDGSLNAEELKGVPNPIDFQQMMRQGFAFLNNRNAPPTMKDLGKEDNAKVGTQDLLRFFQDRGLNSVKVVTAGAQPRPGADAPSNELLRRLDADKDGKLSKVELAAAFDVLARLDKDGDEMISLAEISPQFALGQPGGIMVDPRGGLGQPGQAGQDPNAPFFHLEPGQPRGQVCVLMLALYDNNGNKRLDPGEGGFTKDQVAALDRNQDGGLDLDELATWIEGPADVAVDVAQGNPEGGAATIRPGRPGSPWAKHVRASGQSSVMFQIDDLELHLQAGTGQAVRFDARQNLLQQFRFADAKNQGFLTQDDLKDRRAFLFQPIFPVADRDRDGKLTEKEVLAYAALQAEAIQCTGTFSLVNEGRNLIKLLDVNRDGRLSPRELKNAWQRVREQDRNQDGVLDAAELPRQFHLSFQPGMLQAGFVVAQQQQPILNPPGPRNAPLWFRKMDLNGDGDVSVREFLGPLEMFREIDVDGDGLIDSAEALRFDEKWRQREKMK